MNVKELVSSKIEVGYDLYVKYNSANPFNNGVLNDDLKAMLSKDFFEDLVYDCDDESEKNEYIRETLKQFKDYPNIEIDKEFFFELFDAFTDEKETEYSLNGIKITREELESCEDLKEFNTMMSYVTKYKNLRTYAYEDKFSDF